MKKRRTALVIGASMTGLFSARVLADHFEKVTVLERDTLPSSPGPRKGVPQARHTHGLLAGGRLAMEAVFPGLTQELVAAGATLFDSSLDVRLLAYGGWAPRLPLGLMTIACTRDLLEWHIRRRLGGYPNISFLPEAEVTGLLPTAAGNVAGVRLRARSSSSLTPDELTADLVLDASGRNSRATDWLEALGRKKPVEESVNSFVGYATRITTRPPGIRDWTALTILASLPVFTRAAVILPIEADRWMVTLAGYGKDYPPLDEAGFIDFARSLERPQVYESLAAAKPLTPIVGYQQTENLRRHFERVADWPRGFAVIGDAACSFNPVYGQGMTNAAISARILDSVLRRGGDRFEARFQRALARHNQAPWLMATNEDFRLPATLGRRPGRLVRLGQRYLDYVLRASTVREDVYATFFSVVHMVQEPWVLFYPRLVARALRYGGPRRRRG